MSLPTTYRISAYHMSFAHKTLFLLFSFLGLCNSPIFAKAVAPGVSMNSDGRLEVGVRHSDCSAFQFWQADSAAEDWVGNWSFGGLSEHSRARGGGNGPEPRYTCGTNLSLHRHAKTSVAVTREPSSLSGQSALHLIRLGPNLSRISVRVSGSCAPISLSSKNPASAAFRQYCLASS
jgi:hypothetical protein